MRVILILLVTMIIGWGQQQQVVITTPAPLAMKSNQISGSVIGVKGQAKYYYWVAVNYGIGKSFPGGPIQVNQVNETLSGSNYVQVSWASLPDAVSYDLLRTTTNTYPNTASCSCAVSTAISATSYNDISNSLSSYTASSVGPASAVIMVDNVSSGGPTAKISINNGAFVPIIYGLTTTANALATTVGINGTTTIGQSGYNGYIQWVPVANGAQGWSTFSIVGDGPYYSDASIYAKSNYRTGLHLEEPTVGAWDTHGNNVITMRALGTDYDDSDYVDYSNTGLIWSQLTSNGLIILNSTNAPIRIVAGGYDWTKEYLRITPSTGVISIGPHPSATTATLGYRNNSGVLEVNNGTSGTTADISVKDITATGLATTGAASGKTLVCADTNGKLYRSSDALGCNN